MPFDFIHSYHVDENYINALANSIKVRLKSDEFYYFLITVFLCVMKKMGDYYREHCKQTTIAVVNKLGLTENQWE